MNKIKVKNVDLWEYGDLSHSDIVIEKVDKKIFVNGQKVTMEYNEIQLWFQVKTGITYRLFDDRITVEPDLTIREIYEQLK